MGMDKLIKNNRPSFEFHNVNQAFVCESSKQEITKTVVEKEYFRPGGYLRPFASDKGANKFYKMAFLQKDSVAVICRNLWLLSRNNDTDLFYGKIPYFGSFFVGFVSVFS